ncbi:hypothetical protein [Nocardia flavorosea]|uniref:Uncharacterized protein n=1 Tax=Nocardia flavorosea TaxID=53429 RepID=A0A846YM93_9NOCA|nr:hypothetical protein [Nocardia flavorosea]NKY60796.1 hypothetical protein [Nocardia flavorosea]
MSGTTAGNSRYWLARGYRPAEPSRTKLRDLINQGVVPNRLANGLGVHSTTLNRIWQGRASFVHPNLAAAINRIDPETAIDQYSRGTPYVDAIILDRIISGADVTVAAVDKPAYARALYTEHGWNRNQIARKLGISWTRINHHLGVAA